MKEQWQRYGTDLYGGRSASWDSGELVRQLSKDNKSIDIIQSYMKCILSGTMNALDSSLV